MVTKNTIQLNSAKSSSIDFNVTITGTEKATPSVRFVIENLTDGVNWVVPCKKLDADKWQATFPAFGDAVPNLANFSVEVIVDDYYFKPAQGVIQFTNTPDIAVESTTSKHKPIVVTSFNVNQIDEASGGPEVTGQYAPTNGLLKKEEDPTITQGHVKTAQAELDDQFIEKEKLDDIVDEIRPGEGKQYPQDDEKEDEYEDEDDFDPRKVAESIIQQTVGLGVSFRGNGEKKGSLFQRDIDGKVLIPGLETASQKQNIAEREKRIRDALR